MEKFSTEKVEHFNDRVSAAATFCNFDALEDDMVMQIVTKGLKSDKLRKELLSTQDLDMMKARNICHLFTSAEESNKIITDKAEAEIAVVQKKKSENGEKKKGKGCSFCHSESHWIKDCPKIKEVTCHKCNKKGHLARFCKNKKVREIVAEKNPAEVESEESF